MIRKIFVGIALLIYSFNFAQSGSVSPYSFFGLGENRNRGIVENQTMGGISLFADSTSISLRNPAAYGRLQFTTYTAAVTGGNVQFENNTAQENSLTASFEYLALGFPISKKVGVGFGILPFTSVGYELESVNETADPVLLDQFVGDGGINRAFLSIGYAINKNFSIGITGNYDFGQIENETLRVIQGVELATRENNESSITGVDVNLALNYEGSIGKGLKLHSSITYAPEATLNSRNERDLQTVSLLLGAPIVLDSDEIDLEALGLDEVDLIIPETTVVGLGLGKLNKWFIGAEYEFKKNSNFENPFLDINNVAFEDATRFSVGGFFIPKYNSFTSYWKKVTYRAGFRYEEIGIRLNNTPVNDFGISFGLGLPVGGSKLNVGFEGGRRGTTTAGRIEETYFNVNLSLTLLGKWFRRVKFN